MVLLSGFRGCCVWPVLCSVLHCTVLHCTALHCTALYCTVPHCTLQASALPPNSGGSSPDAADSGQPPEEKAVPQLEDDFKGDTQHTHAYTLCVGVFCLSLCLCLCLCARACACVCVSVRVCVYLAPWPCGHVGATCAFSTVCRYVWLTWALLAAWHLSQKSKWRALRAAKRKSNETNRVVQFVRDVHVKSLVCDVPSCSAETN